MHQIGCFTVPRKKENWLENSTSTMTKALQKINLDKEQCLANAPN
jgi:hypothetical protein